MKISIAELIIEMTDNVRMATDYIRHEERIEDVIGRVNWTRGRIGAIEDLINIADVSDSEQDELELAKWTLFRELMLAASYAIQKHRDSITPAKLEQYMSKVHEQLEEATDEIKSLKEEL